MRVVEDVVLPSESAEVLNIATSFSSTCREFWNEEEPKSLFMSKCTFIDEISLVANTEPNGDSM